MGRPPVEGVPLSVLILNRNRIEQRVGCLTAKGNAVHRRLWCTVGWSPPAKVFDAGMVSGRRKATQPRPEALGILLLKHVEMWIEWSFYPHGLYALVQGRR